MTSTALLVSVVTPSYNAVRFIAETIRSVQAQDYAPIEHIVMDGGSTDGTVELLRQYPHLKWISEPDRGQSDALNKGFKLAQGQFVGWLNADDTYNTGAVATAVKFLQTHPEVSIVYGDCAIIDEASRVTGLIATGAFSLAEQVLGNRIPQPSVFLRRSAVEASGGVNESLHYVMDYDLWLRLAAKGFKFAHVPGVLANFRICAGTKSVAQAERFWPEIVRCYERFFAISELPDDVQALKHQACDRALWQAGLAYFAAGDVASGRDFCRRAVEAGRLLETEPDWAVIAIVEQAFGSNRGMGEQYALTVLRSLDLPAGYGWFTARFAPARVHEALAFMSYQKRDLAVVRRAAAKSIALDPSRLRNLGLVSIFAESLAGATLTDAVRAAARRLRWHSRVVPDSSGR